MADRVSFLALAFVLHLAGLDNLADFAKLGGMTALGFWFLSYFETVSVGGDRRADRPLGRRVLGVARPDEPHRRAPRVDVLAALVRVSDPGEHTSANLGMPDLLFFTLFLGAADRWNLRVRLTWLFLVLSLGSTLALAVAFDLAGLPALPFLSFGFLLANCDLLWKQVRGQRPDVSAIGAR